MSNTELLRHNPEIALDNLGFRGVCRSFDAATLRPAEGTEPGYIVSVEMSQKFLVISVCCGECTVNLLQAHSDAEFALVAPAAILHLAYNPYFQKARKRIIEKYLPPNTEFLVDHVLAQCRGFQEEADELFDIEELLVWLPGGRRYGRWNIAREFHAGVFKLLPNFSRPPNLTIPWGLD